MTVRSPRLLCRVRYCALTALLLACSEPRPDPAGGALHDSGVVRETQDAEPSMSLESPEAGVAPTSADDEAGVCGNTPFPAAPRKVSVLLVLDASQSMERPFEGTELRKWDALKRAVLSALEPAKSKIAVGLQVYPTAPRCGLPSDDDPSLTIEVAAGQLAVPLVRESLDALSLMSGTPTAAALARAVRFFRDGTGASLEGDRYVLLATDGGPNCNADLRCESASCVVNMERQACEASFCCESNCCEGELGRLNCLDDVATLQQVQALRMVGVRTFVVGLPGTEAFAASLDMFAEAGGVAAEGKTHRYFEASVPDQLASVLAGITASLVTSCKLQLDQTPPDLDRLNVTLDGITLPQEGADGWRLDLDTTPPTLLITGGACERIERGRVRAAEVVYGCPTLL